MMSLPPSHQPALREIIAIIRFSDFILQLATTCVII